MESGTPNLLAPGDDLMLGDVVFSLLRFSRGVASSKPSEEQCVCYETRDDVPVLSDLGHYTSCYVLIDGHQSRELATFIQKRLILSIFRELRRARQKLSSPGNLHAFVSEGLSKVLS